ncbi:hypothetical protein [Mesorhizobium sp. M0768]|uniref:hypothetical protein n=1 Tax=Mesorhizobium sp. M0768 TaxID=2956996 RepID=UPI003334B95E
MLAQVGLFTSHYQNKSETEITDAKAPQTTQSGNFRTIRALLYTILLTVGADPAFAQTAPDITKMGTELAALAVVVVVIESALTTIFQWRVYRMLFNNRAMKTVVMVAVGLTVVIAFHYDIFARMIALVTSATPETWSGKISTALSALIIAGGSAGVNTLLQRLGIRNPVLAEPVRPALKSDEAWISVKVNRTSAIGPIQIAIREMAEEPPTSPLAGTIEDRSFWARLKEAFTADAMRFPTYGGRTVKATANYEIAALGIRAVGGDATQTEPFSETIYSGSFAPRAIVDFTVNL